MSRKALLAVLVVAVTTAGAAVPVAQATAGRHLSVAEIRTSLRGGHLFYGANRATIVGWHRQAVVKRGYRYFARVRFDIRTGPHTFQDSVVRTMNPATVGRLRAAAREYKQLCTAGHPCPSSASGEHSGTTIAGFGWSSLNPFTWNWSKIFHTTIHWVWTMLKRCATGAFAGGVATTSRNAFIRLFARGTALARWGGPEGYAGAVFVGCTVGMLTT